MSIENIPEEIRDGLDTMLADFDKKPGNVAELYIGIDPGATGALGFLLGRHSYVTHIPCFKVNRAGRTAKGNKKTTTVADYPAIVGLFEHIVNEAKERELQLIIALEKAQVQIKGKGSNAYTGFRVGVSYGMWPLFFSAIGLPLVEIAPITWKKKMKLTGQDKNASVRLAKSYYPNLRLIVSEPDLSEALLIATYCRQHWKARKQ